MNATTKITAANIATIAMAALIAFHNEHAAKPVKKFADRKTAEKRVLALLATVKPVKKGAAAKTSAPKAKRTAKPAATPADRSASIAASWTRKEVAAARSARHAVKVGGDVFKSLPAAFRALNLPMGQMIKTRLELVRSGKVVHANHKFVLVAQ